MTKPLDRLLCLAGAAILGGAAAVMAWRIIGHQATYLRSPALALACVALLFAVGALVTQGWYHRFIRGCSILMINTSIVFALAEGTCRVAGIDFNELLGARTKNEAFPIYFRLPSKPSGEVFFTRDGPAEWSGKPLTTLLKNHRSTDIAYTDEADVTIRYDKDGFRNPADLKDWDIALVGDSFTESGYLPEEQIFTGLLASKTGQRVKNLGVTNSGNYSHTHYLRNYGVAPSCRKAVLAFFEGNDLHDNVREHQDLEKLRSSGIRPSHEIPYQPSLLKTLYHFARDFRKLRLSPRSYANAYFKAADGKEIALSIADAPPSSAGMTPEEKSTLSESLAAWAAACRELNMESSLVYLPCKRRVLHGHLRQGQDYPEPNWQPGDLPAHVQAECAKHQIRFIDATPQLTQKAAEGVLTFNTIYDTHFNAEGHRVIAELLAQQLKP